MNNYIVLSLISYKNDEGVVTDIHLNKRFDCIQDASEYSSKHPLDDPDFGYVVEFSTIFSFYFCIQFK